MKQNGVSNVSFEYWKKIFLPTCKTHLINHKTIECNRSFIIGGVSLRNPSKPFVGLVWESFDTTNNSTTYIHDYRR